MSMSTSRFRRLPLQDEDHDNDEAEAEEGIVSAEERKARRAERVSVKLHALLWLAASGVAVYASDFIPLLTASLRDGSNISLHAALICLSANLLIMLYLTLYLPLIKRVTLPWEVYCPRLIPISTALGLLTFLFLIIAFWQYYGLLTPFIILLLAMGLLFSTHFIPWPC